MTLSLLAKLPVAVSLLPSVASALIQEAIDVAVIVKALRVLAVPTRRPPPDEAHPSRALPAGASRRSWPGRA